MRIEAMLTRDDIASLVDQLMPLKVLLGDDEKRSRSLNLMEPRDVALVSGSGLRVVCRAVILWPVLGVSVPVTLSSLGVLLRPHIAEHEGRQQLLFRIELEHTDLAGLPAWFDARLTGRINKEMSERKVQLAWDFIKTVSHAFPLPDMLDPVDSFVLQGEHGTVSITDNELRLKLDFRAHITRHRSI